MAAEAQALERQVRLPDGRRLRSWTAGPNRASPAGPVVVLVHGLGGTAREWHAVQRAVARYAHVFLYERAGYQGSDAPTEPPTPVAIAKDLRALLRAANTNPPYLLVGHSYGGVIASQYLHDYGEEISGLVLIDSVPVVKRVPGAWTTLLGGSSYEDVVGLIDNLGIDRSEHDAIRGEAAVNEAPGGIAEKELHLMYPENQLLQNSLMSKGAVMGKRPLIVIFCDESNDFKKVYEHGIKNGHGTVEEQETVRKHLVAMSANDEAAQREQLALSTNSRFIETAGARATHNVQLVDPEWVALQIRWACDGGNNSEAEGMDKTSE